MPRRAPRQREHMAPSAPPRLARGMPGEVMALAKAVAALKQNLGKEYGMLIDGKEVFADEKFDVRSPINTDWVLRVLNARISY